MFAMDLADKAVDFISRKDPGPFFLDLAFLAPHSPRAPSKPQKKHSIPLF